MNKLLYYYGLVFYAVYYNNLDYIDDKKEAAESGWYFLSIINFNWVLNLIFYTLKPKQVPTLIFLPVLVVILFFVHMITYNLFVKKNKYKLYEDKYRDLMKNKPIRYACFTLPFILPLIVLSYRFGLIDKVFSYLSGI
jgi:hypothetical protein